MLDWVTAGVLNVWGRVGDVTPLHLVLALTLELSKPRLCHDEQYLNIWIRDLPFRRDRVPDLPKYVLPGHFQTSFDDKNGYQHVLLHFSSRTYYWPGMEWCAFRVLYSTVWLEGECLYHNLGLFVTGTALSLGVPVSQYTDDRHVDQLFRSPARASLLPSKVLAEAAACILCYLLIEACYFIGIAKSQWVASTIVRFLDFLCDSTRQALLLPDDKELKFSSLREQMLASRIVGLKMLQRFAGEVVSFSLAVPHLYPRDV